MDFSKLKNLKLKAGELPDPFLDLVRSESGMHKFSVFVYYTSMVVLIVIAVYNFFTGRDYSNLIMPGLVFLAAYFGGQLTLRRAYKKGEDLLTKDSKIVLASIVQANNKLFSAPEYGEYPAVVVYSMSEERRFDEEWLTKTADKIFDIRNKKPETKGEKYIYSKLNDEHSFFKNEKVPIDVIPEAETYWSVELIFASDLSRSFFFDDRKIIPYIAKTRQDEDKTGYEPHLWEIVPKALWPGQHDVK